MNILFLYLTLFLFLDWRTCDSFFWKNPWISNKNKNTNNMDIKIPISIEQLSTTDQLLLKKINGFYGLLGPNMKFKDASSLHELLLGDGAIQGVFFNGGNLTFIKYIIQTEKVKFEKKFGKIPMTPISSILFMFLTSMKFAPNMNGVANTALLHVQNQTYALFEYDKPYLLNIDKENNTIHTIKYLSNSPMFSAHTKHSGGMIETINYDLLKKQVSFYQLSSRVSNLSFETDFIIHKNHSVKTIYIPFTHDFISTEEKILVMDSPVSFSMNKIPPIYLNSSLPTYFYLLDKKLGHCNVYKYNQGLYLFHYSHYKENQDNIEVYGSFYDTIDFCKFDIHGKYRKIIFSKRTNAVSLITNSILEKYNLDFPICIDDNRILLVETNNSKMIGFVITIGMSIVKRIVLEEKYICGEPRVIIIENVPYLLCFLVNDIYAGSLFLVNLNSYSRIEIPIKNTTMNTGFHSIFL